MRPVVVDGSDLQGFGDHVARMARRVESSSAAVDGACARFGAGGRSGGLLVRALRRRAAVLDRLRALAFVIALAAHVYTTVEQEIASSLSPWAVRDVGPPPWAPARTLVQLLDSADPGAVQRLLVTCPALAALVVDTASAAPDSDAAALGRLLAGAERGSPVLPGRLGGEATAWAATDRAVHDFLTGLAPRRLLMLALLHPALVAGARAAPPQARYAACRVLVAADLHRLLTQVGACPPGRRRAEIGRRIALRRQWLTGSVVLRHPDGSVSRRPHQLLWFDGRGDGQVVEVLGDLRRAAHLAVFVPGTGSDLRRYPGTLARMVPFAAADPQLAVVVWQGADFPDQPFDDGVLPLREHVIAAAYRDAADRAGPALAADVEALKVAAPAAAGDLTVLGHSYGGSVVGSAEAHGLRADRVVHVASAGMYTARAPGPASGFTPGLAPAVAQHFSMTAYDDPIRLSQGHGLADATARVRALSPPAMAVPATATAVVARWAVGSGAPIGHGPDPDLAPGVVRLDLGRYDDSCRLVRGHSGMFAPGTTAWRNLLATMNGGPVQVLEPTRWASHLAPWSLSTSAHGVPRWAPPHYVVDGTPWSDPAYGAPMQATR